MAKPMTPNMYKALKKASKPRTPQLKRGGPTRFSPIRKTGGGCGCGKK